MAKTDNEHQQPKSVLFHTSNISDFLNKNMGMIEANSLYNNQFLQASEVWKFVHQVIELIDQDIIDLRKKPELKLNADVVNRLDKIYNGGCYLVTNWEDDMRFKIKSWSFLYEKPINVSVDDVQELPSFRALNPTKEIDSDSWSINIRASIPFRFAFAGYDYATVIQQGNFIQKFAEGIVPRFEESELNALHLSTHDVSRKYWNTTIEILTKRWLQQWIILFGNIHKIIKFLEDDSAQFTNEKTGETPIELGND